MSTSEIKPPALHCFAIRENPPRLVAGVSERDWMDDTSSHFAYRCTPLSIANASGWELLNPSGFSVTWTGGQAISDIIMEPDEPGAPIPQAASLFGHGIITMYPGYLFRNDPGWMMWVRGAPNRPKHGIHPLDGMVETSWLPFMFTMNWKFTEPGTVHFARDEPFCFITLVPSIAIEGVQPIIQNIEDAPEIKEEFDEWNTSRVDFMSKLRARDEKTIEKKWEKNYLKGASNTGRSVADETHRVKRSLKSPIIKMGEKAE